MALDIPRTNDLTVVLTTQILCGKYVTMKREFIRLSNSETRLQETECLRRQNRRTIKTNGRNGEEAQCNLNFGTTRR